MNYSFHPEAEQEFTSAIDYYEDQHRDLGFRFAIEVFLTIRRITAHPASGTIISGRIRRLLINRFPLGVLYHFDEESNHVFIVAIMHLRRNPDYWKQRIEV
jgi:plasmid stabilization system protein ParE